MAKKLFYTITEIADELGINASTIRFWEDEFPILRPKSVINSTKKRKYTAEEMERVRMVHYMIREKHMTLQGVREYIERNHLKPEETIDVLQTLTRIRQQLCAIRDQLDRRKG